ncbi:MAG: DUF4010 domain-containing protein [Armatimonadota bacterium]
MGELGTTGAGGGGDLALALRLQGVQHWPYLPILTRIALAVALGLFVGMERERRGKEAGMRTFALASLVGCLGGLLGDAYALLGLALLGVLIVFLNWQRLVTNQTAELTTSVALVVTGVMGVLCGKGHDFTPVVVGIFAAALLAWKERMTHFSVGLTETELRAAILLAILAFVIYPVLPAQALDPWGLILPRSAWVTVLLIAAVGFGNYILLKLYGMRGVALAGFLAGLVNSTVAVTELAQRIRETAMVPKSGDSPVSSDVASFTEVAYEGTLLATTAMLMRNTVLLLILAPGVLVRGALLPLALMLGTSALLALVRPRSSPFPVYRRSQKLAPVYNEIRESEEPEMAALPDSAVPPSPSMRLESPFSLQSALKFGLVFLALHAAGTLAQRWLGPLGFYAVSIAGGLVSSSSAVASAASLAIHDGVTPVEAGIGAVLASLSSAFISLPLLARVAAQPPLTARVGRALALITTAGIVGAALQLLWSRGVWPL